MSNDTRRLWLPAEWLDEINPTMLETPDGFIAKDGSDWVLRLPEGDPYHDNEFYRTPIEPGQIVNFLWSQGHGFVNLTVAADGTWTTDFRPPEAATHFYEPSFGVIANSIDQLVQDEREPLEPGTYEISAYAWSRAIAFRFDVDADGCGKFTQTSGAN